MILFLRNILIFIFIFFFCGYSFSQNNVESESVQARFLEDHVEIVPGKSFFNILLVENKGDKEITINIQYNTPKDWEIIGNSHEQVTIQPLSSISLPVRVAVMKNAKGGIGYAIVAIITSIKGVILNSQYSFIKIPVYSKVKIFTKRKSYYLDHKNHETSFQIDIKNEGNISEAVNLELIPDKTLEIEGFDKQSDIFVDYNVDINKTNIRKFKIRLKSGVDLERYKLFKVKVIIRTTDSIINKTIWFKYLDWKYKNIQTSSNTPLNIKLNAFNILSSASPSYQAKVFGAILLKNKREIIYSLESLNRGVKDNLYVNSRIRFRFNTPKTTLFIGDYQKSIGQSMHGRGIAIKQNILKKDFFTIVLTKKLLSNIKNVGGLYSHSFKALPLSVEFGGSYVSNSTYTNGSYVGYSSIGTTIFKKHIFRVSLASSKYVNNYKDINNDSLFSGWAYVFDYTSHFKKLKVNVNSYYSTPTFSGMNNGRFYMQTYATYKLSKKSKIILSDVLRNQRMVYYLNNVLNSDKFLNTNNLYLRYSTSIRPQVLLFTGPILIQNSTNNFYNLNPNSQFSTNTLQFEIGLRYFESYTNNSLSFSGKYGFTNVADYSTELNGITVNGNVNALYYPVLELTSGYHKKEFNLYIKYLHGPNNLSKQFTYFYSYIYSKSLIILPSYERFIYKKSLKLFLRLSYLYDITNKTNSANINTGIFWQGKKGLEFSLSNSISYQKVKISSNYSTSNATNYLEFGISKRFNIQQPRIKMYNYEAIYYKDLNGNRIHDANEPGVSNVLSDIQRNNPIADEENPNYNGEFLSNNLLSNSAGRINYKSMPEGEYVIKYSPQNNNLGSFTTESVEKTFSINSDTVMHIPFVEKNKLFGKITLNRTKHSALGNIPIDNIKVTVEGNSKTYSTLTDKDGYFELYIPVSDYYKVKINNIFHEHFKLRQDYYIVKFNGYKQFEVSFDFDEKERKIAFDESDFLITDEDLEDNNFSFDDIRVIKQTNLKGEIKDANSLVPLHATVSIHNVNTNQLISETASSKRTGVYFTSFFAGDDYNIKASAKGYWVYKEDLNINQITTFENITKDILLNKIFLGEEIKADNLKFDSESAELSPLAKAELDNILALLFLNPTVHIEILGHADNLESLITDAIQLSKTRASSVASYLVKHGLRESRIKIKGLGSSYPKSFEDTNAGRQKNRSVEIKVTAF